MGEIFNIPTGRNEWVRYRLTTVDKNVAVKVGDFDGDGKEGTVADYAGYYKKFKRAVDAKNPFFAAAAKFNAATKGMGESDFIHNVMSLAASAMKPEEIAKAYGALANACGEVWRVVKKTSDPEKRAVAIVKALGPAFKLLTRGVKGNRKVYDEPGIFGGLIAEQMGLKGIGAVIGPKDRVYLQYRKDGRNYYLDSAGKRFTELELRSRISNKAREGVYLAKLSKVNLLGMMVLNRGYKSLKTVGGCVKGSKKLEAHALNAFTDYMISSALLMFKSPLVWKSLGNTFLTLLCRTGGKYEGLAPMIEASYQMSLVFDGGYAPALSNLGIVAGRKGSELKAIKYYEAALFYEPDFPQAQLNICTSNIRLSKFVDAVSYCTMATKHEITAASAYVQRAKARLGARKCDGLFIADLVRAIRLDPRRIAEVLNLVILFNNASEKMGVREYKLATSFLIEEVMPRAKTPLMKSQAYTVLGGLHKKVKKYALAVKAFKKAVATNPSDWRVYYEWARMYAFETKEYDKAVEKLDEAIAAGSNRAEIYFSRGIVRLFQKKYVAALPDFVTAAKKQKGLAYQSFMTVARCIDKGYFKAAELPKVRTYLDELIKMDGDEAKAYYYYRAEVNKLMGDKEAAADDRKKAAEKKPAPKCGSIAKLVEEL